MSNPKSETARWFAEDVQPHESSLRSYLRSVFPSLPDRCRQVLTLRLLYGMSQKGIAAELRISEHTVKAQLAKGMRRCAEFLSARGLP